MDAGRWVTAEVTLLVAVPRELEIAEVRHVRPSPFHDPALRGLLASAFAQLARLLCELDQRLGGRRFGWGEPGQARAHGLERLPIADARQRRRPKHQQL